MSRITFENYARRTRSTMSYAEISGRYEVQDAAQRHMVADVGQKLALRAEDRLLEIGCSVGNLLIPLSFVVGEATGIDHPDVLALFNARFTDESIRTIPGNFLDVDPSGPYDKILVYSVLSCLGSRDELFGFIDKACDLLAPGGRVLFGDLPNVDRKRRFTESAHGRAFLENWKRDFADRPGVDPDTVLEPDPDVMHFSDALVFDVLAHARKRGFESFVLPQPPELPFGNTREDILIVRSED